MLQKRQELFQKELFESYSHRAKECGLFYVRSAIAKLHWKISPALAVTELKRLNARASASEEEHFKISFELRKRIVNFQKNAHR
jgi:hypothetical protein